MPLIAANLATELESLIPVETEAEVINNLATAWENYFSNASVAGVATVPGTLTTATTAMKSALVGISGDGQGASKLQAGIIAFWGVVVPAVTTIWVVVPPLISAISPPSLSTIAASLTPVFLANKNSGLDLAASALAVANVLHPLQLGGTVTQTGAPPVVLPIL